MGAPWLVYKGRRLQSFTLAQADNNRCWPKLPDEPNLAFALLVVRAANLSLRIPLPTSIIMIYCMIDNVDNNNSLILEFQQK